MILLPRNIESKSRGQILIEVIIVIATIATFGAALTTLIVVAQRAQESGRRRDIASGLAADAFAAARAIVDSDDPTTSSGYNRIYCPPSGLAGPRCPNEFPVRTTKYDSGSSVPYRFRPFLSGRRWFLDRGEDTITIANIIFTRYFTVANVCRNYNTATNTWQDITGAWEVGPSECTQGGVFPDSIDDPATQRLTTHIQAARMRDFTASRFFTRSRNVTSTQTDWGGVQVSSISGGSSVVEWVVTWDDPENDAAMVHICRDATIDGVNQVCPGGSWADSPAFSLDANPTTERLTYTPVPTDATTCDDNGDLVFGDCGYHIFVCDVNGACTSPPASGTFTVN